MRRLEMLTPAELQEDLKIARDALERGHPGIYRYTSKSTLDKAFEELRRKLNRPMDVFGFFRLLAPVIAKIECGHTSVNLPESVRSTIDATEPLLPLRVEIIGGKVYVLRDYSGEGSALVGTEIRAINGKRIETIVATIKAALSGDGEIPTSRQRGVGQRLGAALPVVLDIHAPFLLTYRKDGAGTTAQINLPGLLRPKIGEIARALYPQDQRDEPPVSLAFLDKYSIAVMTIRGFEEFSDRDKKKPMVDFFKESFSQFQRQGTRTLILDLRGNGGGEDVLGKLLYSYLTKEPFDYYDDLVINALDFDFMRYAKSPPYHLGIPEHEIARTPDGHYRYTSHPNWGRQQPSQPAFTGKVFVIIDGGSFSTTCEFLSIAHYHRRVVFIGEEAGGGYYGNTSGYTRLLELPNTKVTLRVPFMKYVMAVHGYRYPKRGVMPNYPVRPTVADRLNNRDPEMAAALALAQKSK